MQKNVILLILLAISIDSAIFTPRNVEHAWNSYSSKSRSNTMSDIVVQQQAQRRPILTASRGGGEETRGGAASTAGVAGMLSKRTFTSNQLAILK